MGYITETRIYEIKTEVNNVVSFSILETRILNQKLYGFIYIMIFDFRTKIPSLVSLELPKPITISQIYSNEERDVAINICKEEFKDIVKSEIRKNIVSPDKKDDYRIEVTQCIEEDVVVVATLYGKQLGQNNLYTKDLKSGVNKVVQNVDYLLRSARHEKPF